MALLEPGFTPGWASAGSTGGRRVRVGRVHLPAEARIDRAIDAALAAAELDVIEVQLPGWDAATAAAMDILAAEAWQVHHELWREHADLLSPDVSARLKQAASVSAADVARARQQAGRWDAELAAVFARVDVLALPTLAAPPPSLDEAFRLTEIRYVAPFNLAGMPAVALPVATDFGIPASLQLAGPAMGEEILVATAAVVEEAAAAGRHR
jgi:amidase